MIGDSCGFESLSCVWDAKVFVNTVVKEINNWCGRAPIHLLDWIHIIMIHEGQWISCYSWAFTRTTTHKGGGLWLTMYNAKEAVLNLEWIFFINLLSSKTPLNSMPYLANLMYVIHGVSFFSHLQSCMRWIWCRRKLWYSFLRWRCLQRLKIWQNP
jgi:hypothetical protein